MKLCALLSGGKDSNYALYKALNEGHEVSCIVVVKPKREDSWLFHSVYPELALLQAEAMGIRDRAFVVEVSGEKEREVEELETWMTKLKSTTSFDGLVCGAISSTYQLKRFERIARKLDVKLYAPLWSIDQEQYLRRLVSEGFVFIITKISTMGLPKRFLAKPITVEHVESIIELSRRYKFNPAFEGGEAETLVIDAPHYKYKLCIEGVTVTISEFEHLLKIHRYWLGGKGLDCLLIN